MLFSCVPATNNSPVIFLSSGPPISLSELPAASTTQIDPSLMAESPPVGQSAPATPAAPRVDIPAPSIPCLKPVLHVSKHKICEEFSANDIDQLLHAIISANPYLVPCSQITNKWKEVTKIVQAEGACIGHDHETLKNKVKSLLTWVQVCLIFIFIFIHFYIFQIG